MIGRPRRAREIDLSKSLRHSLRDNAESRVSEQATHASRLLPPIPMPILRPARHRHATLSEVAQHLDHGGLPLRLPIHKLGFFDRVTQLGRDGIAARAVQQKDGRNFDHQSSISSAFSRVLSFSKTSLSPFSTRSSTA